MIIKVKSGMDNYKDKIDGWAWVSLKYYLPYHSTYVSDVTIAYVKKKDGFIKKEWQIVSLGNIKYIYSLLESSLHAIKV
jgi:hypothetical protein